MHVEAESGRCPSCGAVVEGASFCNQCGAPLERKVSLRKRGASPTACSECGAATSPDQAFCTGCGARLRPLPGPGDAPKRPSHGGGPAAAPTAASAGRQSRTRWLVGLVVAGVLLGSVGVYALIRHNRIEPALAAPSDTPNDPVGTTAEASPTQSSEPTQPPFLCWDGTTAHSLKTCPVATQAVHTATPLAGLNWVLLDRGPRLEDAGAVCRPLVLGDRLLHRSCVLRMAGAPVCLNYSQWRTPSAASPDYDRLGAPRSSSRQDGSTLLLWGPKRVSTGCQGLGYKAATMIDGQPWGVTAYSDVPSVTLRALSRFGQFRLTTQWRGVRQ